MPSSCARWRGNGWWCVRDGQQITCKHVQCEALETMIRSGKGCFNTLPYDEITGQVVRGMEVGRWVADEATVDILQITQRVGSAPSVCGGLLASEQPQLPEVV